MKKILLIISCFILFGCTNAKETDYKEIMKKSDYLIVDVRTSAEYNELHIKNAINIPVDEIDGSIDLDKDKIIFVYCKSGNRSKRASTILENLGYKTYDLGAITNIDLPKE